MDKKLVKKKETNNTIKKFCLKNLLFESKYFMVIARPEAPTKFSVVIIDKLKKRTFIDLSVHQLIDYHFCISKFETIMKKKFKCKLFNYYTLMLVDKDFHTHIFPRFSNRNMDSNPGKILNIKKNIYKKNNFNTTLYKMKKIFKN